MGAISIIAGAATISTVVAACVVNARQGRTHRVVDASVAVMLAWALGEAAMALAPVRYWPDLMAIIDFLLICRIAWLYDQATSGRRRASCALWLAALCLICLVQLVAHLWYQTEGLKPGGIYALWWASNIGFALTIACLWWGIWPHRKPRKTSV